MSMIIQRPHSSGNYNSIKSSFTSTYPIKAATATMFKMPQKRTTEKRQFDSREVITLNTQQNVA